MSLEPHGSPSRPPRPLCITIVGGPFLSMPPAPSGAVERVWHGLAEGFARKGHAVVVLCKRYPGQSPDETNNGDRYVRHASFSAGRRLAFNLLKDFAYSLRVLGSLPRADVLVTNTFWLPALAPWLRRSAGRVAVHVARMPKGQLFLYDRVGRLQAVSEAVREEIGAQRPRLLPKVRVLPYPVDTRFFIPPAAPRPDRPPLILYAGRIHPEKGIGLLLEALGRVALLSFPMRLRVIGPWQVELGGGGRDYLEALRHKAGSLPVEFADAIFDRQRLAAEYQGADLFCYPSLAEKGETFGVAPLEAMATGLVPVVSDLACFRDFITDGVTGVVFDHRASDSAERLARILESLVAGPARRQEMADEAARKASSLSYECVADLYLADFAEMLAQ